MQFHYTAVDAQGTKNEATIDAANIDGAVALLQKKGLSVVTIEEAGAQGGLFGGLNIFAPKVKPKDLVIFSRQIATLFEAGVSALKGFRLLAAENDNKALQIELTGVADDIESGISLSAALEKRPKLFSPFYINMVRAGEEDGKLNEAFIYLADYLDREYELRQKVKKALTYPSFVIATFILIMIGMFTFVIPKMAAMFADNDAQLPAITKVVLAISSFLLSYWIYGFILLVAGGWFLYRWIQTEEGRLAFDTFKSKLPVFKTLYQRIFLTRLADNMNTMLTSGVPIVRSIEITAAILDNAVYEALLKRVSQKVQTGTSFSKALYEEPLVPNILVQMVKIGEETGELGYILKNLATFYKRELDTTIDNIIGLIEPAMIVALGIGVGILVSSVLLPMYSLSDAIS